MDSNWGSSSNSELEDQWEERRLQLMEKNEEDDTQRSKNDLMAATAASWRVNNASQPSFSPHQRVTIALRIMAYTSSADAMNDTFGMSESSSVKNLAQFCYTIVHSAKIHTFEHQIRKAEDWGFPGMIGLLDCMHWQQKNCPTGWQGSFSDKSRKQTIVWRSWPRMTPGSGMISLGSHDPKMTSSY
ncbi:hypothetical protein L3X38_003735 [Prunus dulcis]|uniref:Uncharacterized protein n=1 Tax=Prunus dulcis TaxID=3755 RepID=A0AAD4ZMM6_PRUDU|nr:hypothetical protein L3X38_003735 [Prunus dulcis]